MRNCLHQLFSNFANHLVMSVQYSGLILTFWLKHLPAAAGDVVDASGYTEPKQVWAIKPKQ